MPQKRNDVESVQELEGNGKNIYIFTNQSTSSMTFNEDSRVKIPALLDLIRLGYKYIPFNLQNRIEENNIFPSIFIPKIASLNSISEQEAQHLLDEINLELDL